MSAATQQCVGYFSIFSMKYNVQSTDRLFQRTRFGFKKYKRRIANSFINILQIFKGINGFNQFSFVWLERYFVPTTQFVLNTFVRFNT